MRVTPLKPFGVAIASWSLPALDEVAAAHLQELLAHHGVCVFPGQTLDDAGLVAALRHLGPLTFTAGERPVPGCGDLNVVSNVGRTTPPRSTFHVDTTYVRSPPAYTALRAVTVPEQGGATLFSDQYTAYDSLSARWRERLAGRTITHIATGVDPGPGGETAAEHPVFLDHPISGRTALYLSAPPRCAAISGVPDDEVPEIVRFLHEHSTREENVLRHRWSPGDVVIWDNRCVMHRADHTDVVGDRVLHRGLVAPLGAPLSSG